MDPFTAGAVTGALGTERPALTARFSDSNGSKVDGNTLTTGTYTVDIVLSGMANISMFQMTANYSSTYISSLTVNSVYSDDASTATESCGVLNEDGKLVFGFISTNDDCSPVNSKGTVLATLSVTIAEACDFADAFVVSDDPECTLAGADFGDGTDSAYTLAADAEYPMTCDMSPILPSDSYDVSGTIMIATDVTGTDVTGGIGGITVSVTVNEETISATTSEDGTYILAGLPEGEYTMSISGPTTIDRDVTLNVSADKATDGVISVDSVGIIVCDYNKDGYINGTDAAVFSGYLSGDYYVYADLNVDSSVNGTDAAAFAGVVNQTISYSNVTL
ncbi:MAG: dockerin type I domain-containing protein [Eubacterium sp.]